MAEASTPATRIPLEPQVSEIARDSQRRRALAKARRVLRKQRERGAREERRAMRSRLREVRSQENAVSRDYDRAYRKAQRLGERITTGFDTKEQAAWDEVTTIHSALDTLRNERRQLERDLGVVS